MNKTAKGALAAGTAAVLLMGGAGSLAYWNATDTNDPDIFGSGHLKLVEETGAWTLNGAPVADLANVLVVPGDELVYAGSYIVDAAGDNVAATVSVVGGAESGTLAPFVETTTVFELAGEVITPTTAISGADDNAPLTVDITVDFPFGASVDNDSQEQVLDLTAITTTLTQTDASA
ncbi:alternate-type signal peptide domain-containing protein [Nocardioides abyssi]|uniref:Alternate-type signal peptide domain-containing protein n=1 Tax=Nocardioides abyssi TaxID=3058370 RepID=A0ABT8EU35_9ACTN|nr:alternate-type signal peptide domain-containing protein [Nocardioides abyssi]MDN4161614.1 alternate-type signal peptide domain-containing protein [Nocardioides abyssi]